MNSDIKALLAICTILILVIWNISLNYEVKKEFNEKIEAMSFAIDLNKMNDEYIIMIDSLNEELDTYMFLDKLKDQLGKYQEGLKN